MLPNDLHVRKLNNRGYALMIAGEAKNYNP